MRYAPFAGLLTGAILLFTPMPAHADAGIPMLAVGYPAIILFLAPVIAIEALYLRHKLHTDWKTTLDATTKANLTTMLLGYPLAWMMYFGLELLLGSADSLTGLSRHLIWTPGLSIGHILYIVFSAAWMGPNINGKWDIPLAFVVLLIPSFILSGFIESHLLDRSGWLHYEGRCARYVWQANILSYIFLAVTASVLWVLTWRPYR